MPELGGSCTHVRRSDSGKVAYCPLLVCNPSGAANVPASFTARHTFTLLPDSRCWSLKGIAVTSGAWGGIGLVCCLHIFI
jgi:hypothetical protein